MARNFNDLFDFLCVNDSLQRFWKFKVTFLVRACFSSFIIKEQLKFLRPKEIHHEEDATELQTDLYNIFEWTKLWGMDCNIIKCLTMTISNKRKQIVYDYHLENIFLTNTDCSVFWDILYLLLELED